MSLPQPATLNHQLVLLLAASWLSAAAAFGATGSLSGRVTSVNGTVGVPNVTVTVQQSSGSFTATTTTSSSGRYSVSGVPAASFPSTTLYTISFTRNGFQFSPSQITASVNSLVPDAPGLDSAVTKGSITVRVVSGATGHVLTNTAVRLSLPPLNSVDEIPAVMTPTFSDYVDPVGHVTTDGSFWTSGPTNYFAARYISRYEQTVFNGIGTVQLSSDDGSALYFGSQKVIDNDGLHLPQTKSWTPSSTGQDDLTVFYFERTGSGQLSLKLNNATWYVGGYDVDYWDLSNLASGASGTDGELTFANVSPRTTIQFAPIAPVVYTGGSGFVGQDGPVDLTVTDSPIAFTDVTNLTVAEDSALKKVTFTVDGGITPPSDLLMTYTVDSNSLLETFTGTNDNGTIRLSLKPALNAYGATKIRVKAANDFGNKTAVIDYNVTAVNDPPVFDAASYSATTNEDSALAIPFTISDLDNSAASLHLIVRANTNPGMGSLSFGGSNLARTLTLTPAADSNGTATVTVALDDGALTNTATFQFTINAVNDVPQFTGTFTTTTPEDTAATNTFNVFDVESSASSLVLRLVANSNPALVPDGNVFLSGTGSTRRVSIQPLENASGSVALTLALSDPGGATTQQVFTFNVTPVNDPPTAGAFTNSDASLKLRSARFAGSASTVSASSIGGLAGGTSSCTVEAWIKTPTSANTPASGKKTSPVSLGTGAGSLLWTLETKSSKPLLKFGVKDALEANGWTLEYNTWYHIATVWNVVSNTCILYVDGISRRQISYPTGGINLADTALLLGAMDSANSMVNFLGGIDELRIWNRALSLDDIIRGKNYPLTGSESQLALYWRFDEGAGTRARDSASRGGRSDGVMVGVSYDSPPGSPFGIASIGEDQPTAVYLPGFDVETYLGETNASLTFTIVQLPQHGVLNRTTGSVFATNNNPVIFTPATNYAGSDSFTYRVVDNAGATSGPVTVNLNVQAQNDLPVITSPGNVVIEEGSSSAVLNFVVGDTETPATNLIVSVTSDNTSLIPEQNVLLGGSFSNRTIVITPAADQIGTTALTLLVQDADGASAAVTLLVRVLPKPAYALLDLGALPNRPASAGYGLNDSAWVVGAAQQGNDVHGALFLQGLTAASAMDLGLSAGASSMSTAFAINNSNVIAGFIVASNAHQAALWQNQQWTALGFLNGGNSSEARAINRAGTLVGFGASSNNTVRGFVSTNGVTLNQLPVPVPGTYTNVQATGISDDGTIVGFAQDSTGRASGVDWSPNGAITVRNYSGSSTNNRALGINNGRTTVGFFTTNGLRRAASLNLSQGKTNILSLPAGHLDGLARAINDFDQIVGESGTNAASPRAFVNSAGVANDLNNLIYDSRRSGTDFAFAQGNWRLTNASGINAQGFITGTGIKDGVARAYLAVPAWVIGRPIPQPEGTVARQPEIELLDYKAADGDSAQNSFFWSGVEQRLYAIRPVTARLKWFTSFTDVSGTGTNLVVNTDRVVTEGISVWPKDPTIHIATVPSEVEPGGAFINYSFQTVLYSTAQGVSVDPNTKRFSDALPGYSVLYYLETDGFAPNPAVQRPVFSVVKTVLYTDAGYSSSGSATVGQAVVNATHSDYGRNGYVFFANAFYDGAGANRAYDRDSRLGPIIPVNKGTASTANATNGLAVVWYHTNNLGVAWSDQVVNYAINWPANPPTIVIASALGSGSLPAELYLEPQVYNQPDPRQPGYNPNEEHALMLPGSSGPAVYALRDDLNSLGGQSDPYVLLKFRDPVTQDWRIQPYRVVAEGVAADGRDYTFRYAGKVGQELAAPLPLSAMPLCPGSYGVTGGGPWWQDYKGKFYARGGGPDGAGTNVQLRLFYPLQPGFWYDLNLDGTNDASPGACVAWLDRRAQNALSGVNKKAGAAGEPVTITYDVTWPTDAPVLEVGSTLLRARNGLPDILNQALVQLIYDDLTPKWAYLTDPAPASSLARLYDPISTRTVPLGLGWVWPDEIQRVNVNGKEVFPQLPYALKARLSADPINGTLSFSGVLNESFGAGPNPLLLPNVITPREFDRLKQLAPNNSAWASLMTNLYWVTRNPNRVDLDGDGQPDNALRVGLTTNDSGQVVLESFGGGPKSLTAGLASVPSAAPKPGLAFTNSGAGAIALDDLGEIPGDFTFSIWARLDNGANGALFTNALSGGAGLFLRADLGAGQIQFSDRAATTGIVYQISQTLDLNWHHYALVRSGTNLLLYLDGIMIASRAAIGPQSMDVRHLRLADRLAGQIDEFQVWTVARSGSEIRNTMNNALNNAESGLLTHFTFDDGGPSGTVHDATPLALTGAASNGGFTASTAPTAIPPRFITLVANNDASLPGLPVTLYVIRVEGGPYTGDLKILPGDNVFDERVTIRHSSDFGAAPENVSFEWYYKPDETDFDPTLLPDVNPITGDIAAGGEHGWLKYSAEGFGVNDVTIGEGGESSLLTLGDNWFICRFKGYAIGARPNSAWSDWVGDPAGIGAPRAALVEGWIKRVIRGLNPFDARTADFHSSAVNTYASMLVQAGHRFEGPIAFNPSADNLNGIGLVEAYQTVLERARGLSIDGSPPVDFDPADNALLLVASKLADLYVLLGNESYADAQDPTIGFGTSSGEYGTLAPSIFAFQNQLDSLLSEELVLLRGRDDSNAGVRAAPVYNRLFWNFTLGDGEVAYKQAYNIADVNFDGFINEQDARILYPQGHGDAWGHYLTAIDYYYALMRHPFFTWKPRTEHVTVAGTAVEVDFLDERKFARVAAAKAQAGKEIVDLEYRNHYVEDPAGQWQGYKDADRDRAWGVDDWARRAGQGAFFDWAAANAVMPARDPNPAHTGIQKIDRTTVTELNEIVADFSAVQAVMDEADAGLNPLGLAKGALPFDIDPTFLEVGSTAQIGRRAVQGLTQFDQILERAVKALANAGTVWDQANKATQFLRQNQDSADAYARNVRDQEFDQKNRLIEIFGYPYAGDIGVGKTYPSGYDGPDLYHHMYVNATELTGDNSPPSTSFTAFFRAPPRALATNDYWLGFDPYTVDSPFLPVIFPQSAADYGFVAPASWGERRAPGELQMALSDLVQANAQLKIALRNYDALIQDIQASIDLLKAQFDLNADKIEITTQNQTQIQQLNTKIIDSRKLQLGFQQASKIIESTSAAAVEAIPKEAIVGTSVGGDMTSPVRGVIVGASIAVSGLMDVAAEVAETDQLTAETTQANVQLGTDIQLMTADQRFEVQQRIQELQHQIRDEAAARLAAYNQAEVVRQTAGRYAATLADGERLIEQRVRSRQEAAGDVSNSRYQDMTFRVFRNDALQKYRAAFDLAARYVYLAANAYDYEVNFLGTDQRAGQKFLTDIVRQRNLGELVDGDPAVGVPGLADSLARMEANWSVLKTRFGVINPQIADTRFSLRQELFRINGDSPSTNALGVVNDSSWTNALSQRVVPDLWQVPEFRRYCRPFAPESAGPQPGLIIRFPTTITFGLNYFGWPLAGGDSNYDPSQFSTKISKVGVWFSGSDGTQVSQTPRVYLVPVGTDILRSPTGDTLATREWRILDQVVPVPFPIGQTDLNDPNWIPLADSLGGSFAQLRRYAAMPARHDAGIYAEADLTNDSRLVGRSAWNTEWMLIIPGGTLLNDPNAGLQTFINTVEDIKLFFQTYSYSGD